MHMHPAVGRGYSNTCTLHYYVPISVPGTVSLEAHHLLVQFSVKHMRDSANLITVVGQTCKCSDLLLDTSHI